MQIFIYSDYLSITIIIIIIIYLFSKMETYSSNTELTPDLSIFNRDRSEIQVS